ncbi:MAG: hypothetical protein IT198_05485 [Acidimicrobiia bacterium]|nr:hypothetical protein [Acidimicrobiia bacterium]
MDRDAEDRAGEQERRGDVGGAVGTLVAAEALSSAVELLERHAVRMLADGDVVGLRLAIARIPSRSRTLTLDVADADAAVRCQVGDLGTLEQLAERARTPDDPVLRAWVAAAMAEHFFWQGDLVGLSIAARALEDLPGGDLGSTTFLSVRGRLRRMVAIGRLFGFQADSYEQARTALAPALADFGRAGWEAERVVTAAMFAVTWASVSWDRVHEARLIAAESADQLRALESPYLPLVLTGLAVVCFIEGDLAACHVAADEADEWAGGSLATVTTATTWLRNLATLIGGVPGSESLAAVGAAIDGLRAHLPQGSGTAMVSAASVLADLGRVEEAEEWFGRADLSRDMTPYAFVDREAVAARLGILRGEAEAVDRLEGVVSSMRHLGLGRLAGVNLLRAARDAERGGWDPSTVEHLRREGVASVPEVGRRTLWEALWAQPLAADPAETRDSAGSGPVNAIRVLVPDPIVVRDGKAVTLPDGTARLLAVLIVAHRPLTVDQLAEALWPDAAPEAARVRLNSAIYRMRRLLGLGQDELVRRRPDGIELDAAGAWRVDAWDFWDLSEGSVRDRVAAFESYAGDLCARQLAYDEAVLEARTRLRARFTDLAIELMRGGHVEPRRVAAKMGLLEEDPLLAGELAAALEQAGFKAEASAVRGLYE